MRFAIALWAVLAFTAAGAAPVAGDDMPAPADYAYGWPIEQAVPSGFQEFST